MGLLDNIKPNAAQQEALKLAERISASTEPDIGIINGPAGTGKTTTLQKIVEKIGNSIVIAPTGRAALRVSEATNLYATTIHRWLYSPTMNEETGDITYSRRIAETTTKSESRMVIVDEAPMITREVWNDLVQTCIEINHNILLVGDERQLPPIHMDDEDKFSIFTENLGEVVTLTEVMRQAADSRVLAAATEIRQGHAREGIAMLPSVGTDELVDAAALVTLKNGVVICHRNETRFKLNGAIRASFGKGDEVTKDERLLVTKNNYDLNWLNGEVVSFEKTLKESGPYVFQQKIDGQPTEQRLHFIGAIVSGEKVVLCREQIFGNTRLKENIVSREGKRWARRARFGYETNVFGFVSFPFVHVNLGWTLTCHKAQGSQWDHVLVVVEPSIRFNEDEGLRWLYTAVTRAAKSVEICQLRSTKNLPPARHSYQFVPPPPPDPVLILGDLDSLSLAALKAELKGSNLLTSNTALTLSGVSTVAQGKALVASYRALVIGKGVGDNAKNLVDAALELKKPVFAWDVAQSKLLHLEKRT